MPLTKKHKKTPEKQSKAGVFFKKVWAGALKDLLWRIASALAHLTTMDLPARGSTMRKNLAYHSPAREEL